MKIKQKMWFKKRKKLKGGNKEMVKKKELDEIPTLGEKDEKTEELKKGIQELEEETEKDEEVEEPKQEESKVLLVTNEQLIQSKLDNLGLLVQELVAQINSLIEVLKRRK